MKSQFIEEKYMETIYGIPFEGEIRFLEPMKKHTSLRIGGPADVFVMPQDLRSLGNLLAHLKRKKIPFFPLGDGTNILVRDGGIEGVVISFKAFKKIKVLIEEGEGVEVYVEAGMPLQRLVSFSQEKGYSGIEGLAGIPGSFGGAVCGNAGAYGYEIKDVILSVLLMNAEGETETILAGDIKFGYRKSSISSKELLIGADIKLKKDRKEDVSARIKDFIKRKWESQPISAPSAGCVFKNPPGLRAGKMIDEAGCKGMRIGDVEVSNVHANFFINKGNSTASDFIRLMGKVTQRVGEKFGIILEPEIKIVGRE